MSRPIAIATAFVLAGCTSHVGMFVRTVHVDGMDLVVERCQVLRSGDNLQVGACSSTRERLPVRLDTGPQTLELWDDASGGGAPSTVAPTEAPAAEPVEDPPMSPELRRAIGPVNAQMIQCARDHGGVDPLRLVLDIGPQGTLTGLSVDGGGAGLTACLEAVLARVQFPSSGAGAHVPVKLRVPEGP